jgi:hypothetical protein
MAISMRRMLPCRFKIVGENGAVKRVRRGNVAKSGNRSKKLRPTLFWIRVQKYAVCQIYQMKIRRLPALREIFC